MSIDLSRAASFMAAYGRVLDRRRFELARGNDTADTRAAVLAAIGGYRNPDGGYGWGLEPDLRARESQPGGALHALEAIADAAPATSPHAVALLDWLQSVTLPDGGLPFALPLGDPTACAPFWVQANPRESSLQITAAVAAQAHRAARSDENLRDHPWLATATRYCFEAIRAIDEAPFAYVLSFALQFLDVADSHPEAHELLEHLAPYVPPDGAVPVAGGAEGETLHLLDFAPEPGRPVRALLDDRAVADDLDRLERGQRPDGGWAVDFTSYSPAAELEWRGHTTVRAVAVLRMNGR
ncbi:hypothetical protein OG417_36345 [Actinoallomurus sp. NBC_01490]|uniref:hypothetical protein n=1 Tax=Actinoallomurus sp. NBC_01490 TaxID=2903557 RepID=UPI002E3738E9|nr:hypothetical protein [Actinoallomurus sp. NBC_01490]